MAGEHVKNPRFFGKQPGPTSERAFLIWGGSKDEKIEESGMTIRSQSSKPTGQVAVVLRGETCIPAE